MQLFEQNHSNYSFEIFSTSHLVMVVLFLIGSFFLYFQRKRLAGHKTMLRVIFLLLLLFLEGSYHYWLWIGGKWDVSFALPLHLCSISVLLCLLLLIFQKRLLFQLTYYIGIAGATMAILTPELFFGYPHFRYFQFFFIHMIIVWTALLYIFSFKYSPSSKGVVAAFISLNIFAIIAAVINYVTDGNYMFLSRKPATSSVLDFFGPYPYYIFVLEAVAVLLFVLMYLPFKDRRKDPLEKRKTIS
ncbi:TIGR02206 family membrane protein [Cytobacillus sp. FSL K6-0129]|uniref:YwaF family protein n=1 Tax=Cytobacillus sp. FSL K6-0129 TaxID=2921421 RepID=UPI0030F50BE0